MEQSIFPSVSAMRAYAGMMHLIELDQFGAPKIIQHAACLETFDMHYPSPVSSIPLTETSGKFEVTLTGTNYVFGYKQVNMFHTIYSPTGTVFFQFPIDFQGKTYKFKKGNYDKNMFAFECRKELTQQKPDGVMLFYLELTSDNRFIKMYCMYVNNEKFASDLLGYSPISGAIFAVKN